MSHGTASPTRVQWALDAGGSHALARLAIGDGMSPLSL